MYSPPNGGWPQEIPPYYKGSNGIVRTDLQSLSHEELLNLGWTGPHQQPIPRSIENIESIEGEYSFENKTFTSEKNTLDEITSGWISKSGNGIFSSATFDPEDNSIELPENVSLESGPVYFITTFTDVVENYDFNPEIERWDWDDSIRQYIIINLKEEELNRPIPPINPPLPTPSPNWDSFEIVVLQSEEMKNFVETASTQNILVSSTFPAAFYEAKRGNYNTFQIVWTEIKKISTIDPIVVNNMIAVATACNLPQEFINIISG